MGKYLVSVAGKGQSPCIGGLGGQRGNRGYSREATGRGIGMSLPGF